MFLIFYFKKMDAKSSSILNKKFPECANEALALIRSNYNRVSKQELTHLANEYVFFNEYNKEQNVWVKVSQTFISNSKF